MRERCQQVCPLNVLRVKELLPKLIYANAHQLWISLQMRRRRINSLAGSAQASAEIWKRSMIGHL